MKISTDRRGWEGTFALTVEFALKDILNDVEPVPDVTIVRDLSAGATQKIRGSVREVCDGRIVFADGPSIDIDNIISIEIEE